MAKSKFEERFKLPAGFEKDLDSRVKITKAIDKFFKLKKLKKPESYLEKRGKDYITGKREKDYYGKLITSKRREGGKQPHRKFGAIDIAAGVLGPHQEDFIKFMLKEGFRVIDERNAVSESGHFKRGIFHIDDHPKEKGWLRKEIPQKWKEGDKGKKVAIDGEWWRVNPKSGTGGYRVIKKPKKEEIKESIKVEEKFQIPSNVSKIPAWMKKYGWKSKDIGKMVDGKWVGYHPGDIIAQPEQPKDAPSLEEVGIRETESILKDFPTGKSQGEPQVEAPEGYAGPDEEGVKLALEGSAIPLKNENVEFKEKAKMEEYVPSHTSLDQLPEEMKVEDSVEEKVSDPQDLIVDYKKREAKGFQEGGSVLKAPE